MSCANSTKEALSIVDQLKICILKQDQIIRSKNAEIYSLRCRVACLEKERTELKQQLLNEKDFTTVGCTVLDVANQESR